MCPRGATVFCGDPTQKPTTFVMPTVKHFRVFSFKKSVGILNFEMLQKNCFQYLKRQISSLLTFLGLLSAYPWEIAGAAARVGASKHFEPPRQR